MTGSSEAVDGFVAMVVDLAQFLSGDVTLDEIAGWLGAWAPADPAEDGSLVPAPVEAASPWVDQASIARFPGTDVPYAVILVPVEAARASVAAMKAAFGAPRVGPRHENAPLELQFFAPEAGARWRIVGVVRAELNGTEPAGALVTRVLLRRDRVG